MIDSLYRVLDAVGYRHPAHPTLSHMPIGLVFGAWVFIVAGVLLHRPVLAQSARYCCILACVLLFPTALLGYTDWQHYYAGAWLVPIKVKFILAAALLALLLVSIRLDIHPDRQSRGVLTIYTFCLLAVIGMGYFGGELVYGARTLTSSDRFRAGEKLFRANCSSCHPNGGNVISPALPVKGSSRLKDPATFLSFVRNPTLPDGSQGAMPPFSDEEISDHTVHELYQYIVNDLLHQQM